MAAKTAPRINCNGSANISGRHCTLREAQKDTSTMGSSSRCCTSLVSQLANTDTVVRRAKPARML